jgi:homoaconitase/3-isopropylmalate dehydratase large subunit
MGKTLAEKIFDTHLQDEPFVGTKVLSLDRVLCHEITTLCENAIEAITALEEFLD